MSSMKSKSLRDCNARALDRNTPSQCVKSEHNPIPDNIQDTELMQNYARGECSNEETPHKNTGKHPNEIFISEIKALGHNKRPLLKVIRANCLDCCCYQASEVRLCTCTTCNLFPYRMGTNPFRQFSPLSDKQKSALKNGRVS